MTKFYLLIPCVLLAVFALYHHGASRRVEQRERALAGQAETKRAAEEERRADLQRNAIEHGREQAALREQQERERVEKRRSDQEAVRAKILADTEGHLAEAERLTAETAAVKHELAELRDRQARLEHDIAAAERRVDLRAGERRAAEMEAQRTATALLAQLNERLAANQPKF